MMKLVLFLSAVVLSVSAGHRHGGGPDHDHSGGGGGHRHGPPNMDRMKKFIVKRLGDKSLQDTLMDAQGGCEEAAAFVANNADECFARVDVVNARLFKKEDLGDLSIAALMSGLDDDEAKETFCDAFRVTNQVFVDGFCSDGARIEDPDVPAIVDAMFAEMEGMRGRFEALKDSETLRAFIEDGENERKFRAIGKEAMKIFMHGKKRGGKKGRIGRRFR